MRTLAIVAAVALTILLAVAARFVLHLPKTETPPSGQRILPVETTTGASTASPITALKPPNSTVEPVDANSTPEAIYAWRREDKEELNFAIEKLPAADADFLCLTLGLIPRDEMFDKVNVKGRLIRHVNRLSTPAELDDVRTAFRTLRTERARPMPGTPMN